MAARLADLKEIKLEVVAAADSSELVAISTVKCNYEGCCVHQLARA